MRKSNDKYNIQPEKFKKEKCEKRKKVEEPMNND
jgi:hypothetical protein